MSLSAHLSDIYKLPAISLSLPMAGALTRSSGGQGRVSPRVSGCAGVTDAAAVANLINCLARTRVVCVMRRSRLIYASYVSIFITSCKNETTPTPLLYLPPPPSQLTLPLAKC